MQTGGGTVAVSGFTLPTENGQWITADLFRPKIASPVNQVPVVVICPGFERSKETMASYALELARRSIAVIVIDPYNQGASSTTLQMRSVSTEGNGVVPVVHFLADTSLLGYIDTARIGLAGYSAGGDAVIRTASLFGSRLEKTKNGARDPGSDVKKSGTLQEPGPTWARPSISAVFVGGYVLSLTPKVLASVYANVGMDYADHDEGAYRTINGSAEMRWAPEALRLVNSGSVPNEPPVRQVDIGRVYGDPAKGTMRVVYNTGPEIHPLLPYDPRGVAHLITFFTTAFGLRPTLASSQQIWMLKEGFTGLSLVGFLLLLVPCTALLLRIPVFQVLVHPLPPALPKLSGKGRVVFWVTFVVSAGFAASLFVPMIHVTRLVFPVASASQLTWWFPERMNNAILLWAVANGVIGFVIFGLVYKVWGKSHGVIPAMWGASLSLVEGVKTVILALIVIAGFYVGLFGLYALFHVDPRFMFIAAGASFPPRILLVALEYLPLFFIFYLANSLRVNGAGRFEGQSEALNRFVHGLANSVGLLLILVIQYGALIAHGTVFWTKEWIYMDLLFGVVPMMFVLPYFHRIFFEMTGRIYLGSLVTCGVFILMMLTSNVCYLPLS